ncbi:MAG: hypothetical protein JEZ06_13815 [Anaerolineaceae bacterium]|nr:hypothetical protein [Anaerolineaceae bacterium]
MNLAKIANLIAKKPEIEAKLRKDIEKTLLSEGIEGTPAELKVIKNLLAKEKNLRIYLSLDKIPDVPPTEWGSPSLAQAK